jgi:hypothetical protein
MGLAICGNAFCQAHETDHNCDKGEAKRAARLLKEEVAYWIRRKETEEEREEKKEKKKKRQRLCNNIILKIPCVLQICVCIFRISYF